MPRSRVTRAETDYYEVLRVRPTATQKEIRAASRSHSTFEEAFAAAEEAVELLERGDLTLEAALLRYEKGLLAIQCCREILEGAQRRIEVLGRNVGCVVEGDGGPVWRPAASFPQIQEALDALERGGRSTQPAPGSKAVPEEHGPCER